MPRKIMKLILELALITLVIYGIITFLNGITFADEHETAPWCITDINYGKDFVRYE